MLFRFGGDLLSHVLGRSTIGAAALNGRVRDGIGCFARAVTTKPEKKKHFHGPPPAPSSPPNHRWSPEGGGWAGRTGLRLAL